jgi:hypothetical protein
MQVKRDVHRISIELFKRLSVNYEGIVQTQFGVRRTKAHREVSRSVQRVSKLIAPKASQFRSRAKLFKSARGLPHVDVRKHNPDRNGIRALHQIN